MAPIFYAQFTHNLQKTHKIPAHTRREANAKTRIKPGFFEFQKRPEKGVKSATNQKVGGSSPSWRATKFPRNHAVPGIFLFPGSGARSPDLRTIYAQHQKNAQQKARNRPAWVPLLASFFMLFFGALCPRCTRWRLHRPGRSDGNKCPWWCSPGHGPAALRSKRCPHG